MSVQCAMYSSIANAIEVLGLEFYSYIKSLRTDSCGVAPLKKDGIVYSDGMKKAEILNDQFSSVYTNEDSPRPLPQGVIGPSSYPDMPPISVHVNGVAKMLSGLNPHKATGPDRPGVKCKCKCKCGLRTCGPAKG